MDKLSICHWDGRAEKFRCFDFGDFINATDIESNLGTNVGIVPYFGGDIRMRDHDDNNGIWDESIRIMRSKVSDETLQLPSSSNHPNTTSNLTRFLQKLELCSGENAESLHDHSNQSKLKVNTSKKV